jgi:hypothetical protein
VLLAALIETVAESLPNRDADGIELRTGPETPEDNAERSDGH